MKKVVLLIVAFIAAIAVVACDTATSPLVISKVYTTDRQANNLIELYNPGEGAIDLSAYALNFYTNGSKEVSTTIQLEGTIESASYFLIGSGNHNVQSAKEKIDFQYTTGSLPFNGNDVIELIFNGNRLDIIGRIGLDYDYSRNTTMIRLGEPEDYAPKTEYDEFTFIQYAPDLYEFLKNDDYEIRTLEQLYAGPQLESRYLDMPFVSPNNDKLGGGGALVTTLQSIADGDTAAFAGKSQQGFPGGSMRYFYINTPEVNSTYVIAEPWGYVASKYNKQYLLNDASSKTIIIQSIPGYNLVEGNGRSLGLVWVNGALSQHLIVREGLTEDVPITYQPYDVLLTYKKVPYLTFLRYAEKVAKDNGWGVKGYPANPNGEKSPDWNFDANGGTGALATTNPIWEPHLPLPW